MAARGEHVLYGTRNSGSAAVEAALVWVGVPYRVVHASSWEKASARTELKRVNPLQQIPTLVLPDGTVLTESAAILIHLALAHPRRSLLPADPSSRARALRALVYVAANCYAAIGVIDLPQRWVGSGDAAAAERLRAGARKRLHTLWRVFADTFPPAKDGFLFGPEPCAADILAAVVSRWSGTRAHLKRHRPTLHAMVERVEAHPRLKPVFDRHWGAGLVAGPA
ncbi:MAG TPA: glutathione S-transferase family protein [Burkholderiaceae bacterium]|nr:glutathione S-transferase family protein [Burkholderiaceae bacterium]